jgi:phage-related protein
VAYSYEELVYYPYPFRREGVKREVSNWNKQTRVVLPDTMDGMMKRMLRDGVEFRKSRVILSQVFMNHKNTPSNSIILIDGYVQDWSFDESTNLLSFSVHRTLLGQSAPWPRRHMLATCTHVFKGERCRLSGNLPICKKTQRECTAYGNSPRFGAFPWVAARQRRILWR